MYPIIPIPEDAPDTPEQLGTKEKFWFTREEDGKRYLFKEGRPGTGENWAEKVCCEIARRLTIPHAEYNLALWRNLRGVVTPTFVPKDGRLILGNELLAHLDTDYDKEKRFGVKQHTVSVVMAVMRSPGVEAPYGYNKPEELRNPASIFVGYLMLDALVGNQDRHHENWGLILDKKRKVTVAPTFDHASSLGRNEQDATRIERLYTKDKGRSVEEYVLKARSAFYAKASSAKPLSTFDAFQEASRHDQRAAAYWLGKLRDTGIEEVERIFGYVPETEISNPAKEFALRMLDLNRNRLLKAT